MRRMFWCAAFSFRNARRSLSVRTSDSPTTGPTRSSESGSWERFLRWVLLARFMAIPRSQAPTASRSLGFPRKRSRATQASASTSAAISSASAHPGPQDAIRPINGPRKDCIHASRWPAVTGGGDSAGSLITWSHCDQGQKTLSDREKFRGNRWGCLSWRMAARSWGSRSLRHIVWRKLLA